MNDSVLILYLEDDPLDVELVRDKLKQAGIAFNLQDVHNRREYEKALDQILFDLILSDYSLPDYDGITAMKLARAQQPEVPFILISGAMGEEQAVDCVLHGATDYVLKQRLDRLAPAVLRALAEADNYRMRRETEDALNNQHALLATVFENVPSMLMLVDRAGRVMDINRAGVKFAGRSKECILNLLEGEVLGCLNAVQGKDCGQNDDCAQCSIRSQLAHTFNTGESVHNKEGCMEVRRGEKVLSFEFLISTIPIKVGSEEQALLSIIDVSSLKQAERDRENLRDQLTQVQKMEAVGQLAGGVAHDFNNILGAMMIRLTLLQKDSSLALQNREMLKELESDTKRAADLTRQLLLFARRQVMQIKVVDLNDLLGNLLKMLRRLLGEHINLIWKGSETPSWIEADPGMIEQVVMNLCVNARDAMPQGGDLSLSIQNIDSDSQRNQPNSEACNERFVCLIVSDQGCGIDQAILTRIFEPFFTTKEVGKGTGLGLATVHGIVKQHGGWVETESAPGHGSVFRVYLPLTAKSEVKSNKSSNVPSVRGTETILVVEDEPSLRRMVVRQFQNQGYTVIQAANGVEAMQEWERHGGNIDLLFADMVMPQGMSGLELGEKLRSQKPDLPVIISSGYSVDLLSGNDSSSAYVTYLPKPCQTDMMMSVIRALLDKEVVQQRASSA